MFPTRDLVVMHVKLAEKIEEFKKMGIQYTFDGFVVADFLTQLEDIAEIKFVEFKCSRLSVWIGELKGKPKDFASILPTASLLSTITAGSEDTPQGYKLWFEWMLPKDLHYEKQV